eukprot:gene7501-5286_t
MYEKGVNEHITYIAVCNVTKKKKKKKKKKKEKWAKKKRNDADISTSPFHLSPSTPALKEEGGPASLLTVLPSHPSTNKACPNKGKID